jgi:hypothetical protein
MDEKSLPSVIQSSLWSFVSHKLAPTALLGYFYFYFLPNSPDYEVWIGKQLNSLKSIRVCF